MCKSKIHRARVTQADLNYVGSVTLDPSLMEAADILPYEKVQIADIDTGARLETYAIEGERGSGEVCINGAAARMIMQGDLVIIMSYAEYDESELQSFRTKVVFVDARNAVANVVGEEIPGTYGF